MTNDRIFKGFYRIDICHSPNGVQSWKGADLSSVRIECGSQYDVNVRLHGTGLAECFRDMDPRCAPLGSVVMKKDYVCDCVISDGNRKALCKLYNAIVSEVGYDEGDYVTLVCDYADIFEDSKIGCGLMRMFEQARADAENEARRWMDSDDSDDFINPTMVTVFPLMCAASGIIR